MMDLLAPLSIKTLMGFVLLNLRDIFLLKILAKVLGIGGFSFEIFLLFLWLPTGRGTLGIVVTKIEFSKFLESKEFELVVKFLSNLFKLFIS